MVNWGLKTRLNFVEETFYVEQRLLTSKLAPELKTLFLRLLDFEYDNKLTVHVQFCNRKHTYTNLKKRQSVKSLLELIQMPPNLCICTAPQLLCSKPIKFGPTFPNTSTCLQLIWPPLTYLLPMALPQRPDLISLLLTGQPYFAVYLSSHQIASPPHIEFVKLWGRVGIG